ncbi:MAG: F0F1 ATP synthase subunit B [Butyricicoccus sp.]
MGDPRDDVQHAHYVPDHQEVSVQAGAQDARCPQRGGTVHVRTAERRRARPSRCAAATERLSKAKEEAAEIVGSATRRAAERSDEILRESSQQASAMVKKAERVIEQERIKAHKELKDEVADLSVMIASKIVERDVKPEDHERFIEDFIDKVG